MSCSNNESARLKLVGVAQDGSARPDLGVATIAELVHRSAAKTPQATALSALGQNISYAQLQDLSASVATRLINQGLQPGARVGVALPNMLVHPIACLGIIRAGLTAVCVNPLYTAQELAQVFRDSEVKAVFLFAPMSQSVQRAMAEAGTHLAVSVAPGDQLGWRRTLVNWHARRRLGGEPVHIEGAVAWCKVVATQDIRLAQRPAIMAGYWRRAEENATAFTDDGFFRTGDIGLFDRDGCLRLVDRKKELIICSGFKVFPSEIERVLNAHPGVLESAVVPAADNRAGEVPIAYVVPRHPYLDETHVIAHCAEHLVGYKRPRRVIFRDELPKSNVDKILRKELIAAERLEQPV